MEIVLAKGPNFVFARDFIQKEYPQEIWDSLMNRLSSTDSIIWQNAALDGAYPFSIFKTGVFTLANLLEFPEMLETAKMYEYIADRSLNTIYKTFFRLTSPSFVIQNYPRLWDQFFTAGQVEVPLAKDKRAIVVFNLPEIFIDWLPPACLGYSRKAIELAGGQHFNMHQIENVNLDNDYWKVSYEMGWH